MERHKCKLCLRSFSNGRALGGHMRSHMMNLPLPVPPPPPPSPPPLHVSESASFSSSPSSSAEGEEEKGLLSYGLRENPKRSIRVVDPEFSFTVAADAVAAGSVVLQDRESETESSKNNPTRRRSKRARNKSKSAMDHHHHHHHHYVKEKQESVKKFNLESWTETEPVSSISGTTTEEDVAFCLMMLSRDKWTNQRSIESEEEESEEESMEETDDSEEMKLIMKNNRTRGNYKCETCNKVFRSYQALGGHRASHKKIKLVSITEQQNNNNGASASNSMVERKIHECPVCFRVFSSGQALGGHKRSHVNVNININVNSTGKRSMIDLNLPAPYEEDEYSAVSDADFVKAIRQ